MFFGLCNSPATFQTMMNDVLRPFINKNVAILRHHKLFLKPEKCMFEKSSVNYLGLVISRGCVSMDPVKVRGVSDWPPPKKVKEVQSFLGFVNLKSVTGHWHFPQITDPSDWNATPLISPQVLCYPNIRQTGHSNTIRRCWPLCERLRTGGTSFAKPRG